MSKILISADYLDPVDGDFPQWYRDVITGMVTRCNTYDKHEGFYSFDKKEALELYGEKFYDMVEWHDALIDENA